MMKTASLKHKEQLCQEDPNSIHPHLQQEYRISYVPDPETIYVVKPKSELNYDLHA